ncbi:hypothetical protein AAF712_006031 [Marasmius tenuissimus]|uniref:Uncharacterized protein n=1 Tax=Marasmius tenuissimus TaxID=585030 RepID=A0ABR2ZYZ5_9AGAR
MPSSKPNSNKRGKPKANKKRKADTLLFGGDSDLSPPPSSPMALSAAGEEITAEQPVPAMDGESKKKVATRASRRIARAEPLEETVEGLRLNPKPATKRKKGNPQGPVDLPEENAGSRLPGKEASASLEDDSVGLTKAAQTEKIDFGGSQLEGTDFRDMDDRGKDVDENEEEDGGDDEEEEDGGGDDDSDDPFSIYPKDSQKEVKANEAIRRYLALPGSNRLKAGTRAYIQAHASNCSAAGSTCQELSKDILVSREGQLKCLYHYFVDKTSRKTDKSEGRLTGVPYAVKGTGKKKNPNRDAESNKTVKEKKRRSKNLLDIYSRLELPRVGDGGEEYCHCGCRLEDAIWGLYLWKTGRIEYNGKVQGYGNEHIIPRQRNFTITRMKRMGIELDDVWTHVKVTGPPVCYQERPKEEQLEYRLRSGSKGKEKVEEGAEQPLDDADMAKLISFD